MDHVSIDGLKIAYRAAGSGRPLVLLHGGLSDGREWRRQIDALSDRYLVVAWDAPGCGASSDPPESFRLGDYADSLAGLIRALDLDRPHVAGLSFGAGLALAFYERHPTIPASLMLASAYAGWAGSLPPDEVQQRLEGALRDADRPPAEVVAAFRPTLFASEVPRETLDEISSIMLGFHPAGARAMARAFAGADLRHVLPTIRVPTLLLYGEEDARAPKPVSEALHEAIPGSRLVTIPGVGHQHNLEAPQRFNDEVRAFLRSVDEP
jgi:pimeloyl-ACP methyl ester carboxylesterase